MQARPDRWARACAVLAVSLLSSCRSRATEVGAAPDAAVTAQVVADASADASARAVVDAAATSAIADAGACTPMRVLSVHTAINFELRITPFSGALRAKGKTKSYRAYHPALELQDAEGKAPSKHYLPSCNFIPPNGGVPCVDFDACEEPTAADREGFAPDEPPALACRGKEATMFRWAPAAEGVVQVFHAKPSARTWLPLLTLKPKGGCLETKPGVVAAQRSANLDE